MLKHHQVLLGVEEDRVSGVGWVLEVPWDICLDVIPDTEEVGCLVVGMLDNLSIIRLMEVVRMAEDLAVVEAHPREEVQGRGKRLGLEGHVDDKNLNAQKPYMS